MRCHPFTRQGGSLLCRCLHVVTELIANTGSAERLAITINEDGLVIPAWLSAQQLQAAQVSVAGVEEQAVTSQLTAPGRIAFDDSHVAHVFSPVTGRVAHIEARLGEHVRKGAALVTLESPDVGIAAADLGKAEADLQAAEREVHRQRELFEAHAGAQANAQTFAAAADTVVKDAQPQKHNAFKIELARRAVRRILDEVAKS